MINAITMTTIGYDSAETTLDRVSISRSRYSARLSERGVELAGEFGGLQDPDVIVGEDLRVPGSGNREQTAVAKIVDQSAERTAQGDVLGLVADGHERVGDRDAGLDEHRELTREVHQLLLLDLLLAQLEVEQPGAPRSSSGTGSARPTWHAPHQWCRPWSSPRRGSPGCRLRRKRTWASAAPCLWCLSGVWSQWANRVRTTSGMVVTSSSTICIASRSIVRIP